MTARVAAMTAMTAFAVVLTASCDDEVSYADCDYVVRHCRTVCDAYFCDSWSCYPSCWNQCWDGCYRDDTREAPPAPGPDAAPPLAQDASTDAIGSNGDGTLCTPCTTTSDCSPGALCILRGGPRPDAEAPDAGPSVIGFCGKSCGAPTDCPDGFACSQIGASGQCLPTSGGCE